MKTSRKKEKKILGQVCISICILTMAGGCAEQKEHNKKVQEDYAEIMIIGSDNYPPFNYTDTNGDPTGIDVDLAKEAFGRMGYQVQFRSINWEEKKELLKTGKIDCIWGSFSMDGREEEYNWAGPYMVSRQVVAVRRNSNVRKLCDLEDKKVAVQSTTKPEELFKDYRENQLPHLQELISVQNRELIYPFLSKGYVDAIAAHETAIIQYMEDYGVEYRILEEPLQTVGLGVAFDKKDSRGIDKELSRVFERMREDGTEKKILGKYLKDTDKYLEVDEYEE